MVKRGTRRIVMVIASLAAGGAERVMALLAGEFVRRGWQVTLITLSGGEDDHYDLDEGVVRVAVDVMGASSGKLDAVLANLRRVKRLRAAIRDARPDVVLSFMDRTNVSTLMALTGTGIPVVVSERIDPRYYPIPAGWDWMRRRMYPRASAVVVQTESVADWARRLVADSKVHVVPNPVADREAGADGKPGWLPDGRFVLAVGRLDRQKGFDLLLRAFAQVIAEVHDLYLVIVGEGEERQALEGLADELGIDRLVMPGRVKNPAAVFDHATCFVLSSRFEGFPNVLLEALRAGRAVVSFNCPSGPAEILRDGDDCVLVPAEDVDALACAITRVILDDSFRVKLERNARTTVEQYSIDRVADSWERLLESVAAGH